MSRKLLQIPVTESENGDYVGYVECPGRGRMKVSVSPECRQLREKASEQKKVDTPPKQGSSGDPPKSSCDNLEEYMIDATAGALEYARKSGVKLVDVQRHCGPLDRRMRKTDVESYLESKKT